MFIDKVENVVSRMRWKAHFFLHETNATEQYKFGLKSKNSPPDINEMKSFEEDLIELMENIKFRKVSDTFLNMQPKQRSEESKVITKRLPVRRQNQKCL